MADPTKKDVPDGEPLEQPAPLTPDASSGDVVAVRSDVTERVAALEHLFGDSELRHLAMTIGLEGEFRMNLRIAALAKQKKVSPERVRAELIAFTKSRIREREKGPLFHFHRTNLVNFRIIAGDGRLLSRTKVKELHPLLELPGWSASENVMLTRDRTNAEGRLIQPGFDPGQKVGTVGGGGATIVLRDSVMDTDGYDPIQAYPNVSDASLATHCEVVLADTAADAEEIRAILDAAGLQDLRVILAGEWPAYRAALAA